MKHSLTINSNGKVKYKRSIIKVKSSLGRTQMWVTLNSYFGA